MVQELIKRAGGVYKVAEELGVTRQAVEQWIGANRIPAERALAVARLAQARPSEVRPDIYPPGMVA
jgi:DNA-binding transcriptional regulator YdaS (Cro superfamily)